MFRQSIILILALFLTGCNLKFEEPTDKGCIEKLEDLNSEDTSWTCASMDRFSESINVYDYRSDFKTSPVFESNEYLGPGEATSKNIIQNNHFQYQEIVLKLKDGLTDILFNPYFLLFTLGYIIFMTLISKQESKKLMFNSSGVGIILLLFYFLFIMVRYSNELQTQVARATQTIGNGMYRTIISSIIMEEDYEKIELSKNYEMESSSDIDALFKINTCLNNNAKYAIKSKETNDDRYSSVEEMLSDYNLKNKAYIKTKFENIVVDPAIGSSYSPYETFKVRKEVLDGKIGDGKIAYHHKTIGSYTTIDKVVFEKCGSITFETEAISDDVIEAMNFSNFKSTLEESIKAKDYKGGWEKIEAAYRSNVNSVEGYYNFSNDLMANQKGVLVKMFIAYTREYKKALLIGTVIYDNKKNTPSVISHDLSTLENRMKVADQWYKKLNKAICIQNSTLVKDTKDKFADFNPEEGLLEYQCIDFGDELSLSATEVLHEEKDKLLIEAEVKTLREEAVEISKQEIEKLSAEYNAVNEAYIEKVNNMFEMNNDVIRYINEGMSSAGRFFKAFYGKDNEHRYMFREVSDVGSFDYSNSLPHFVTDVPIEEGVAENYFTPTMVNQFLKNSDKVESYSDLLISGTLASKMLEDKIEIGGEDISEGYKGSEGIFDSGLQTVGIISEFVAGSFQSLPSIYSGISAFQCIPEAQEVQVGNDTELARDSSSCINFDDFDGLSNWTNLSSGLSSTGATLYVTGAVSELAGSAASSWLASSKSLQEQKKNDGKTFQAGKMQTGSKYSVGRALSGLAYGLGKVMKLTGSMFMLLGALMKIVFEFPSLVSMFMLLTLTLYLISFPFVLMYTISVSVLTNVTYSDYKRSARFVLDLILHPIKIVLYSQIAIYLSVFVLIVLLQIMPYMMFVLIESLGMGGLPGAVYQLTSVFVGGISIMLIVGIYYKTLSVLGEQIKTFDSSAKFGSAISSSVQQMQNLKNTVMVYQMGALSLGYKTGLSERMRNLTRKTKLAGRLLGANEARKINKDK